MSQEITLPIRPPRILGFRSTLGIPIRTPPIQRPVTRELSIKTRIGIPREVSLEGDVPQRVLLNVLQSRRRLDMDAQLDKKIEALKALFLDKLDIEKIKGTKTRELMKILTAFLAAGQNL